ncbi:glycosyl hydrolase [Mobilicoccus caccae]|nr:glycosyl hydrolase [Mobilicoccus caccae]GMA42396.1 hypothetical protein GCM10025883_44410 [Mobilicoccus caccae]
MSEPVRTPRITIAALVALTAGTGLMPAPAAAADPTPADAVTVIIPVTTDVVTVTVSRDPSTRTAPLMVADPTNTARPVPGTTEQPAPTSSAFTAAPTSTNAPATQAPMAPADPTVTLTTEPATPTTTNPVATITQTATSVPTPPLTQAPSRHTQTSTSSPTTTADPTPKQTVADTASPAPAQVAPEGQQAPQATRDTPTAAAPAQRQVSTGQNASGLTWKHGVFAHSLDRVGRFQDVTGRKVDTLSVAPARGSWATIMDPWWMARPAGFTGTLDVAVPLWQEDGDLATAAAGGYNAQWEELGRMIEKSYPGSTARIGWEFNLGGWKHHATPENVEQWKQAFRHASTSLKKGGPSLLVTWNPNKGKGDSLPDASMAWPGDDVVDVVGLDAYDWWPAYNESTWPQHRDEDQGWKHWVDFARSHGKKFAVPEWGVAPGNKQGGGDNPFYIATVMDYLASEHAKDGIIQGESYFDEPEAYIANSIGDGQVPQAVKALKAQLDKSASQSVSTLPAPATPQQAATGAPSTTAAPSTAAAETTGMPTTSAPPVPGDSTATPQQIETQTAQEAEPSSQTTSQGQWSAPQDDSHGPTP